VRQVEKWKWRIRWAGRTTTTRVHYTEDEVPREHPDAIRLDETRVFVQLPENEDEIRASTGRPPYAAPSSGSE
jgi:hypothetical protein